MAAAGGITAPTVAVLVAVAPATWAVLVGVGLAPPGGGGTEVEVGLTAPGVSVGAGGTGVSVGSRWTGVAVGVAATTLIM